MVKRLMQIATSEKGLVLIDQAVVSGGNFLTSILLARALGIASFGQYSVVILIFFFFLSVVQAFITQPLYTLGNKKFGKDVDYLPALQAINVLLILSCVGVFALVSFFMGYSGYLLLIQLAALFFYLLNQSLRGMGFYKQMKKRVLISDMSIQSAIVVSVLLLGELTLDKVFMILIGSYGISLMIYGGLLKIFFSIAKIKQVFHEHFRFSRWLLVTSGVQWFSGNYLILVADAMLGHAVTGVVRIIQNTLGMFNILLQAMENYVPLKASLIFNENGLHAMLNFLRHIGVRVLLVMLIGLVGFYFTYEEILTWCYQVTFSDDLLILMFCILYVFILAGFLLRFVIRTLEKNFAIFIGYIISTVLIFIIANPIISHWGLLGVAIGFLVTQIVSVATYLFYIHKTVYHESHTYNTR